MRNRYIKADVLLSVNNETIAIRKGSCTTCCFFNAKTSDHCSIRIKEAFRILIRKSGVCRLNSSNLHYERLEGGV